MVYLYYIFLFLFVLVCIFLVGIILMQSSKSGGLGSALSGNAAFNDAFGGQGADKLLTKITTILAVSFMVLALFLSLFNPEKNNSNIENRSGKLKETEQKSSK